MRNVSLFIFVVTWYFYAGVVNGQQTIAYGSNGGQYITILDTKIYYEEYGKGMPLLLLHGGMGSIEDFALCIPGLAKSFRVIAVDSPGQGRSELADSLSYELMAEYMSRFIDQLKLDSAYAMGWSDGGNTALILGYNRPDKLKRVIVSGANYTLKGYPSILNDTTDWESEIKSSEFAVQYKAGIDQYLSFCPTPRDWRKVLIDLNKMWHQEIYFSPKMLTGLKIPVMIVLGDKDTVTLEHGIEMYRMINGSQFCVLPATSHRVYHEKALLINQIAIDFFGAK